MAVRTYQLQLLVSYPTVSSITVLPRPNPIDYWLIRNYVTHCRDISQPEYLHLGDLPKSQVLCTVQVRSSSLLPEPG